jgi:hypothetical protein
LGDRLCSLSIFALRRMPPSKETVTRAVRFVQQKKARASVANKTNNTETRAITNTDQSFFSAL